jgi:hypothetical protein
MLRHLSEKSQQDVRVRDNAAISALFFNLSQE